MKCGLGRIGGLLCVGLLTACTGQLQSAPEASDGARPGHDDAAIDARSSNDASFDAALVDGAASDAHLDGGTPDSAVGQDSAVERCGDDACTASESSATCPDDCGAACGDDACNGAETACNCEADCGATTCGDGCCGGSESSASCAADCGPMCGDGTCNGGETAAACPADCDAVCGDDACTGSETACSCAADCGATVCDDGCCGAAESTVTCSEDCGSMCGDGACNGGESTANCVADCGSMCGDGVCNGGESPCDCASDCGGPACGDGYCCAGSGENICNCAGDCKASMCGDGCCTGAESNATCAADCEPDPPTGLLDRLTTTTLTAPAGVKAGVSNWRVWAYQSLRVAPVFTVPLSNCQTLVGYTTDAGGTLTPRVARLDANDQLVATYSLTAGRELRGLAAEPGGHFGALLWSNSADKIFVHRYDSAGSQVWSEELTNPSNTPDDFNIGDSRLEFGGGRYGAYYHVHSNDGHEGDTLKWVTTAGVETTQWAWGCSHSMSNLLRYNPAVTRFLPVCVTDCYPGTSGANFATDSIGGIYLNHRTTKVRDVNAGCNGDVAGEVGGAALAPAGWKLLFNAHRNAATHGQNSYNTSTMNQDVGFSSVSSNLSASATVWLTNTSSVNEADTTIARWSPAGETQERYLVGWSEAGSVYKLATVSASGSIVEGPVNVTSAAKWGRRDDPMRVHKNGDVVWSWFNAAGDTQLRFARLSAGAACVP